MAVLSTTDLRKNYGAIEALKGVSLAVESGQIYGLLGQNGAGKSTLVKILLGIVRKTDGDAFLLGYPAGTAEMRRKVGYLPEDHTFPGYHTGYSLLDFYGQLYGLSRDDRRKRIAEKALARIAPANAERMIVQARFTCGMASANGATPTIDVQMTTLRPKRSPMGPPAIVPAAIAARNTNR